MSQVEFSIIMPAFNAAQYIGQSISSVRSQKFGSWELIIINDGSTDVTEDIIQIFSKYDQRIVYLYQENQGVACARNLGLGHASGKHIVFLDSDDVWDHDFLSNTHFYLQKYPLVFSKYRIMDRTRAVRPRFRKKSGFVSEREIALNNPIGTLTVGVRRDYIAKFLFDTRFHGTEDWDLWLHLAKQHQWYFADFCSANYRVHSAGISRNAIRMYHQEYAVLKSHSNRFKLAYLLLILRFIRRLIL